MGLPHVPPCQITDDPRGNELVDMMASGWVELDVDKETGLTAAVGASMLVSTARIFML